MAVRVKIELKFKNRKIRTTALAGAGYESAENEILVPLNFTRKFGKVKGKKLKCHTAGGDVDFTLLGEGSIRVITEDRNSKSINTKIIVSPYENEVIINDKLIQELGIELLRVKTGEWRFYDDPLDKVRPSEIKQTY